MTEPAHVVSAAILWPLPTASRILLTKRGVRCPFPLLWCTPGGKVEPGEDPAEALRSEIQEEVDLELEAIDYPLLYEVMIEPPIVRTPLRVCCYLVEKRHAIGVPHLGDGVCAVAWADVGMLRGLPMTPADNAGRQALVQAVLRAQGAFRDTRIEEASMPRRPLL